MFSRGLVPSYRLSHRASCRFGAVRRTSLVHSLAESKRQRDSVGFCATSGHSAATICRSRRKLPARGTPRIPCMPPRPWQEHRPRVLLARSRRVSTQRPANKAAAGARDTRHQTQHKLRAEGGEWKRAPKQQAEPDSCTDRIQEVTVFDPELVSRPHEQHAISAGSARRHVACPGNPSLTWQTCCACQDVCT